MKSSTDEHLSQQDAEALLAEAYRLEKAKSPKSFEAALALYKKLDGAEGVLCDSDGRDSVLEGLAYCHFQLEKYPKAAQDYRRLLEFREQQSKPDLEAISQSRYELARAIARTQKSKSGEALKLYRMVISERTSKFGEESTEVLECSCDLANALCRLLEYREALDINRKVLRVREKLHGPESIELCTSRYQTAINLYYLGEYGRALFYIKPNSSIAAAPHNIEGLGDSRKEMWEKRDQSQKAVAPVKSPLKKPISPSPDNSSVEVWKAPKEPPRSTTDMTGRKNDEPFKTTKVKVEKTSPSRAVPGTPKTSHVKTNSDAVIQKSTLSPPPHDRPASRNVDASLKSAEEIRNPRRRASSYSAPGVSSKPTEKTSIDTSARRASDNDVPKSSAKVQKSDKPVIEARETKKSKPGNLLPSTQPTATRPDASPKISIKIHKAKGERGDNSEDSGGTRGRRKNLDNDAQQGSSRSSGSSRGRTGKKSSRLEIANSSVESFVSASEGRAASNSPSSPTGHSLGELYGLLDTQKSSASTIDTGPAETWFTLFETRTKEVLQPGKNRRVLPVGNEEVRIAILDTGVDASHEAIARQRTQLRDIRSFVQGSDETDDTHGHGTHGTALMLRLVPRARIYVGRITVNSKPDPDAVVKAIEYAHRKWKVDIVSMAFGFKKSDKHDREKHRQSMERIEEVIKAAAADNILFFGAACNSGILNGTAFPARLSQVICIHSANHGGRTSNHSPPARDNTYNFSVLGEDVRSAWPVSLGGPTELMTGTSTAVMIAAAVSAVILYLVRFEDKDFIPRKTLSAIRERLKTQDAMCKLLKEMSVPTEGYDFLKPWELIDMEGYDEPENARQDALTNIARFLKKHYYTIP
ncbi:subtilisin-like protein [Aureobasidium pullulans]|uniref:Subtilisin-like protein n=1 Tax=Aureobasidium pullulans TaxID=5580 RepID=A0A4S9WXD9_AURPU|nr:subtilisin-like protein [Aureobasidium pullulans]THZ47921.1 subtilisin-like protein [Aureobasidium pullulans]THZ59938.1 subtilisin-like protein [Aureobasidium pullulans]THZ70560.1 subtilisin-like protein [Aureobasidium pullulans]